MSPMCDELVLPAASPISVWWIFFRLSGPFHRRKPPHIL